MTDQVIITFPEISDESWKKILDIKPVVEIWDSKTRTTYKTKWDGSRLSEEIKMWFDFPDNIHLKGEPKDV